MENIIMFKKIYWKTWIEFWCFISLLNGAGKDKKKDAYDEIQGLPEYNDEIREWSVIGDSSGNHFAQRFSKYVDVTNYARNGVTIEYFKNSSVINGKHKNVVLMIGGNNLGLLNNDVNDIVKKHYNLYKSIKADRKIVVFISPFNGTEGFSPVKNEKIIEINSKFKSIYRETIDVFPTNMLPSFTDGVHHTYHYDVQIIKKVLSK